MSLFLYHIFNLVTFLDYNSCTEGYGKVRVQRHADHFGQGPRRDKTSLEQEWHSPRARQDCSDEVAESRERGRDGEGGQESLCT
jgi:hypothetical protein